MNVKLRSTAAAIAGVGLAASLVASPAVAAPNDGTWGSWETTPLTAVEQPVSITFANAQQGTIDLVADFDGPGSGFAEVETVNDKGEWIPVGSPPAAIFGANGPSDTENLLNLDSLNGSVTASMTMTFPEPVNPNELGFVVVDIDSAGNDDPTNVDRVTLQATKADGSSLTSAELNAGVFNICSVDAANAPADCAGESNPNAVPTLTEPTPTSVYFVGDLDVNGTGSSGWINPNVAVKSVTLEWVSNADFPSSVRLFVAVKQAAVLADTGVDVASGLISALVFGALGAAAVIITRRRQA